jgi:hypothetical protein
MNIPFRSWMALVLLAGGGCPGGTDVATDDVASTDSQIVNDEIIGILITPERITLPLGESAQMQATGLRADRSTTDLTFSVTWNTANASVVEASNSMDAEGRITAVALGNTDITATLNGLTSNPSKVKVTDAELLGLTVRPNPIVVEVGGTVQLQAEAGFSDGSRSDASGQVLWVPGSTAIATVSSGGRLTAAAAGTTTIEARWGEMISPQVQVQVLDSALPDLRFTSVTGEAAGGYLDIRVTLQNGGSVGAADIWVDVFLNPPATPGPGMIGEDFRKVPWLGPSESHILDFQLPVTGGSHTVVVVADIDDDIEESNESNNTFSQVFSVDGGAGGGPNLTIPYFDYIADGGGTVLYGIDVKNTGTVAVGSFFVDLWYDSTNNPTSSGIGDDFVRVDGLGPGATVSADFFITGFTGKSGCSLCTSWVMVDTNDDVAETNESDNVKGPLLVWVP